VKKLFALLLILTLGLPLGVSAQRIAEVKPLIATASLTTNTCAGASINSTGCIGVNLGGYTHVAVQLTGTWTGTVTFEVSVDNGTTWVTQNMLPSTGTQTAVTSATANGVWYSSQLVGSQFRARFSTATTPPVVVTVRATL
jgi:hypothetical protein